jgi:signal peptidase I
MENIFKRAWLFFLDFIETIVIALAIFVVVYQFLFQPHQVKGNSMYDNLHDGEYLLTDKVSFRFNDPQRDEVIVFKAPQNEDFDYIKRVIGLPGDRVMISNNKVYLNDSLLDESAYLDPNIITRSGNFLREGVATTVPSNSYFVMGDNRSNSSDSRDWGFVPNDNIVGRAWIKYWPLNQMGVIKKYPKLT